MSKKKIIIIIVTVIFVILGAVSVYTYVNLNARKTTEDNYVTFKIESGTSKLEIIDNLVANDVIKESISGKIYILLNMNLSLQAGTYNINTSDSTLEIIKQLSTGDTKIYKETISVTFVDGNNVKYYANKISEFFGYTYEDVIEVFEDRDYAKELISKYDMLTDEILDDQIYYPLEGYLFPDTYEFYIDASIEDIIEVLLDQSMIKLNDLKSNIDESGYTIHEILTIASITSLEAVKVDDRKNVAQVIYSRLDQNIALGMDVTSYYGAGRDMSEPIYQADLDAVNGYNTRNINFIGLPVGPIANPSFDSLTAALNPGIEDYLFFVADVITGEVFFFETEAEFSVKVAELAALGRLG